VTGQLIKIKNKHHKNFDQTEKLFSLTEKELQVARFVDQAKGYVSEDELVSTTGLNKQNITSTLSSLLKKKIVTFERVGKFKRWYSSISLDYKYLFKLASDIDIVYREKPSKNIRTIISNEQVERFFRSWFDKSIVLHTEIVYAPIYIITYARGNKLRKISINGATEKIKRI
jgi:transcription initiation factor IIE alpha subunit